MNRFTAVAVAALFAGGLAGAAQAQDYPTRPVTVIVPSSPGGAIDVIVRMMGPKLTEVWGQQVVVDNQAGGSGIVGTGAVAAAEPDGYTLLVVSTPFSITPHTHSSIPFDTLNDFTPITLLATTPNVLIANSTTGIDSLAEMIERAKAAPGQLAYGSSGVGASSHLGVVLLEQMADIQLTHVPYSGAGQATGGIAANEVPLLFTSTGAATPLIQSGQVVPIAVSSPERTASLPDVPTVAESGFPDYAVESWYGLFGPAGIPQEIVDKIHNDVIAVLNDPDLRARLEESGYTIVGQPPAEFAAYVRHQDELWGEVVEAAGIEIQ